MQIIEYQNNLQEHRSLKTTADGRHRLNSTATLAAASNTKQLPNYHYLKQELLANIPKRRTSRHAGQKCGRLPHIRDDWQVCGAVPNSNPDRYLKSWEGVAGRRLKCSKIIIAFC